MKNMCHVNNTGERVGERADEGVLVFRLLLVAVVAGCVEREKGWGGVFFAM